MTPGDLAEVERSWTELLARSPQLLDALTARFTAAGVALPARRATWLLDAVAQLVGLLSLPSRLAERATGLVASWPDPSTAAELRRRRAGLDGSGPRLRGHVVSRDRRVVEAGVAAAQ